MDGVFLRWRARGRRGRSERLYYSALLKNQSVPVSIILSSAGDSIYRMSFGIGPCLISFSQYRVHNWLARLRTGESFVSETIKDQATLASF